MTKILKGKPVAEKLNEQMSETLEILGKEGIIPTLGIIRIGERSDDISYERGIIRQAEKVGVKVQKIILPSEASEAEVLEAVNKMNEDKAVHGVLIFRPLPEWIDDDAVRAALDHKKDIDGITDMSMAGIYAGSDMGFSPCTPSAVIEVLKYYDIDIVGKKVVVLGRSLVIGRPVSMMLLEENATVTMCHTKTENVDKICREADILVVAVGKAKYIDSSFTNNSQTIIDVGINLDEDGKLCGDVDFGNIDGLAFAVTPVPGGVGTVTSTILIKHVIDSALKIQRS